MSARLAVVAVALLLLARPAAAVEIERVLSPGGIEAWLVSDHTNPIISMRFAFRGGASLDPAGKEGLANMVASTLDEGAGDLDSQAFHRRLEDLSVSLRFSAGRDTFAGRLKTLSENRDAAFGLLALAAAKPRFDAEPVARIRSQILAGLRRDLEDPDDIAGRTLSETLFPGHPYGRPVDGTLDSVAAITADDLKGFWKGRLARDNLVIGVVGDIDGHTLAALLDTTFSALPARAAPGRVPEIEPQGAGQTVVVDRPVPQSVIVFAHKGIMRDDPDFYAAYVMNYVLGGGGFSSRLYDQVREKRGLAYSVYSTLYPLDHAALILGGAGTAKARTAETLAVIRDEWRAMKEGGLSEQELADAKTYLTGSFPLRFTSSGRIAGFLVSVQLDNLGIDYIDERNSYIEAVSLEDANRVAERLLDPDNLTVVVVGQPEGM